MHDQHDQEVKTPEALAAEIAELYRTMRLETEQEREMYLSPPATKPRQSVHAIVTLGAHTELSRD
jgi:hypothetical protein